MFFYFSILSFLYYSVSASNLEVPLKPVSRRSLGGRIINGEEAKDGQFPWQVAIMGRSQVYPRYLCGGALISSEWVLTAGHCVTGSISATIYAGTSVLSSRNRTTSQAAEFIVHEAFDETYFSNDIGLIKLTEPLAFDENTNSIDLSDDVLLDNVTVTVSGWGQISDDDPQPNSDVLKYIEVLTIENIECRSYYGNMVVTDAVVCTTPGAPVKSPCLGDSGAPVVADAGTNPVLVAIFSFVNGYGCEFSYPAGNTRIDYFREWIREKTGI